MTWCGIEAGLALALSGHYQFYLCLLSVSLWCWVRENRKALFAMYVYTQECLLSNKTVMCTPAESLLFELPMRTS